MHKENEELFSLNKECQIEEITYGPKNHFFGFHDICPWNESEEFLLALETDLISRTPTYSDFAKIGIIDLKNNNSFYPIAETSAWNFQQGSRQQWFPGEEKKIIFNDRIDGDLKSVLLDFNTNEKKIFNFPIYSIHPDGTFALGVNFDRLERTGGYGYSSPNQGIEFENVPDDDGISR